MAGTVMMVGAIATASVLTVGLATAGAGAVFSQRLAHTADAAALAAADTVSGAVTGDPCERAAQLAATGDATVRSCVVDGLIATVSVTATFVGISVIATARAGPPPEATAGA